MVPQERMGPLMPFKALGLHPLILKAIQETGYTEPTPIQAAAIPEVIQGRDLIGIAQTGTGKTAAFTLPLLHLLHSASNRRQATRTLVLAPTRELVLQIEENVQAYAKHVPIHITKVFGGVSERPQIEALRSGAEMVIATPGRLLDLMQQRRTDFSALEHLVLDEADRMLDMGFLPAIRRVVQALPKKRQTLLFSATLSKEIEALTHEFLSHPKTVQIGRRSNPAETVTQFVYEVPQHLKTALLCHLLRDPAMGMVLVFTRTKHGADRLARRLESIGIKTGALHANRSQNQRLRALADFRSGAIRVLIATDIASRGIDVDGISHVVNFDFPPQVEDYVHRIGRTGRANTIGDAISFISQDDYGSLRSLERFIGRGIVRKKAEGFDYSAAAPEASREERPRNAGQAQGRGRPEGSRDSRNNRGGGAGNRGARGGGSTERPNRGPRGGSHRGGESRRGGA